MKVRDCLGAVKACVLGATLGWAGIVATAEVDGTVHWARQAELGFAVSGVVKEVHVRVGSAVRSGDPLISLDHRSFSTQMKRTQAGVGAAAAALDEARRELERAEDLYDRTVLSDHELELARIELAKANAAHAEAAALLSRARLDQEYSVLRAPFDGVVLACSAEVGEVQNARLRSVPVVTVAESPRLAVRMELTAAQAANVRPGLEATVQRGGESWPGVVEHLSPSPADGTGRYPAQVLFEPTSARVRVGEAVRVTLP